MDHLMFYIIILVVLLFGIALAAAYKNLTERKLVKQRLKRTAYIREPDKVKKPTLLEKILTRLFSYADDLSDIGERFNFYSESQDVSDWLIQANHPYNLNVRRFQGLKIVLTLIGFFTGVLLFVIGFPFGEFLLVGSPFIGFFAPIMWAKNKANKRQEELSYTLPDFLDMVSVSLKAGASLDQAFHEISSYFEGPLKEEFARFNQRVKLGIPREELYKELIDRTSVPEFQMVIKSLIRGAQLGVPVATTFEIQSTEIRKLRKERAKEEAAKSAPKVTMVTTFVVMPTALLLIGGLVLLNAISNISDTGVPNIFK